MKRLNDEQRKLVEDNERLIYWYCGLKGLDVEEWYGLLAIELCYTAMKFDKKQGSISNYFKIRADSMIAKEISKTKSKKREHNGIVELTDINHPVEHGVVEGEFEVQELLDSDDSGVLTLRAKGYTQAEIADILDISQSSVSRVISKFKEKHYNDR